jgi:hypothetical protein
MNRLTITQIAACVEPCIRWTKDSVVIDYPALAEALNAMLASDEATAPAEEAGTAWCDVCQRNVESNHKHDRMATT